MADLVEKIDAALKLWDTRLEQVDANLVDLDQRATLLTRGAPFEGLTRAQTAAASEALPRLFLQRGRIKAVLTRAHELREKLPRLFPGAAQAQAILALLKGPSIVLA